MSPDNSNRRQAWISRASKAASNTRNPIRELVEGLRLEPNPDKKMIALSIGDPTVFGNLQPPPQVITAMHEVLDSCHYNGYAPSMGFQEAREAVARYSSSDQLTVEGRDVVLCSGCSSALDLCITVLADPGTNILVPRPGFAIYRTLAATFGVNVRTYNLRPDRGWEVDLEHLQQQIDENTAVIVVNNPSNPCGSVFSKQHLQAILAIAAEHFIPIIADEIYEYLVFPGQQFYSMASLSHSVPILSCSGLAKRFLVPGWRMGWIIIHDRNNVFEHEVRPGLQRLSQRIIGSNTLVQGALPTILANTPLTFFNDLTGLLQEHAMLAHTLLSGVKGLSPVMPQGAMYMMVGLNMAVFPEFENELQLVQQLVSEESVFCLPSQCFDFPDYVRIVLTVPKDLLREACLRIASFCQRHYQHHTKVPGMHLSHGVLASVGCERNP